MELYLLSYVNEGYFLRYQPIELSSFSIEDLEMTHNSFVHQY